MEFVFFVTIRELSSNLTFCSNCLILAFSRGILFFSFDSVESCLYLVFLMLMVLLCDSAASICCWSWFFFLFAFSLKRLVAFLYFCFVVVFVLLKCFLMFCIFLYKLGFFSCKAEQSLQGMKLQEKEAQKD